jgi:predicted transcriptional regulator
MPWVPDVNNMSGFEIAGIIVSAIPIVTRVVNHFGSPRNAPRQVERLSRMLAELQDERFSQAAMPTEQKHIHDMVNRCTDILERETTSQKGRVWKFFWSAEAEKLLKEHNDELERELDRLLRRVQMYPSPVLRDL